MPSREPSKTGSSPLTRGKRRIQPEPAGPRGLIPAHAGKTLPRHGVLTLDTAHPRSRGENLTLVDVIQLLEGSSPLTRGKQGLHERLFGCLGLIPAHAGKTAARAITQMQAAAHPRSRGENQCLRVSFPQKQGSSPLTRGKLASAHERHVMGGLIPAHAGKTSTS